MNLDERSWVRISVRQSFSESQSSLKHCSVFCAKQSNSTYGNNLRQRGFFKLNIISQELIISKKEKREKEKKFYFEKKKN